MSRTLTICNMSVSTMMDKFLPHYTFTSSGAASFYQSLIQNEVASFNYDNTSTGDYTTMLYNSFNHFTLFSAALCLKIVTFFMFQLHPTVKFPINTKPRWIQLSKSSVLPVYLAKTLDTVFTVKHHGSDFSSWF